MKVHFNFLQTLWDSNDWFQMTAVVLLSLENKNRYKYKALPHLEIGKISGCICSATKAKKEIVKVRGERERKEGKRVEREAGKEDRFLFPSKSI